MITAVKLHQQSKEAGPTQYCALWLQSPDPSTDAKPPAPAQEVQIYKAPHVHCKLQCSDFA